MEGTSGAESEKRRGATEPSASKQGQEQPDEADPAGVTREATVDVDFASVAEVAALFETLPSANVEVQRILDAARCLAEGKKDDVRHLATCSAWKVKPTTKTERGWRDRPLQDVKRDLQASVLLEARNVVHTAALERVAHGLACAGGAAEPASSSSLSRAPSTTEMQGLAPILAQYVDDILVRVVDHACSSQECISAKLAETCLASGVRTAAALSSDQPTDACGYIAADVVVTLRDYALASGERWFDAPLEPYTTTACVVRGNEVLSEPSEEAQVLETKEVNQLVRSYAHLAEHVRAHEEWWGGAVALDHFIDGVCQFVRSAHDGTVTAEHKWRGWVVNTQTSTQPGSHWFTVCLAVALPRPGMKRASMEGTAGTEPQKQRRVTEPSASRQGQEEPHEADGAGVAGEAKDDLASPQPAAEAQGEGAPRSGSLSKRSASSARAAALDLEEPARKDARRARAAGPAAAASRPKASSSPGEAEGKPNREPDGAESRHRADVLTSSQKRRRKAK